MDLRVERLHPPVQDLGEAGDVGDVADREPGLGEGARGAAGRDELDAELGERAGEVDEAGLVGNGDQRPPHRDAVGRVVLVGEIMASAQSAL